MRRIAEILRQLAYRVRGERPDAELDEEMRLHLELRAEQARARGLDPDAARAEARRRFGNPGVLREEGRDVWGWAHFDGWLRDIRDAFRTVRKSPGFTAVAVVSLALGIGANTAIFSLINALLLRNLPVQKPGELVQLTLNGSDAAYFTNPIWEQVRDHQQALSGVLAFTYATFDLSPRGETEPVHGLWVSGELFTVLGVPAWRGRTLTPEDDRRGCGPDGPVAVISHRLWRIRYGSDEDIVGRTIHLDREPFRIVGVTPPWFTGLDTDRIYNVAIPLGCDALLHKDGTWLDMRSRWWLRVLGRLAPGTSLPAAGDHFRAISPDIFQATAPPERSPERQERYRNLTLTLRPAATGFSATADRYGDALSALMGVTGLVLLIACANIASLLLARSGQRERELSMRMALGAGRARLVRRLLCESALLALASAAAGLALALAGSRLLVRLLETGGRPLAIDLQPDIRVLGFTIAIALLTAFAFGLAPALRATSVRPNELLKEGARGLSHSARQRWLGKAIVAAQVALSLVLVAGAALFAETMRRLVDEDLGFDPRNTLVAQVDVAKAGVPQEQRLEAFDRILRRLRATPGVDAAALVELSPLSGYGRNGVIRPEGLEPLSHDEGMMFFNSVSPGYFDAMRTQIVLGRDFTPGDSLGAQAVIIIDEASARRYWPGENPLGKFIELSLAGQTATRYDVVGVVKPVKYMSVNETPRSVGFFPAEQEQNPEGQMHLVVRSAAGTSALPGIVQEVVEQTAPEAALTFRELEAQVNDTISEQRLVASLSLAFAGLALLLAMIGLYGVTAYAAARRRGEIGVRIALGARPAAVVRLMLRDFAAVVAAGLALGWGVAVALGPAVENLLFGVEPGDPLLLGLAALILVAVGALAAYLPARRASRLQPVAVLREE